MFKRREDLRSGLLKLGFGVIVSILQPASRPFSPVMPPASNP